MQSIPILLPERLKEHVEAEVSSGRFSSASEYLSELVREDLRSKERERIEQAILAGVYSGEPVPMTSESWDELRRELEAAGPSN